MTLEVKTKISAALKVLASAKGLSVKDYLEASGMAVESGILVYRGKKPLSSRAVNATIRKLREERARHILGEHS
jgi:hypothetical protein